jgi:type 1 glutamine amidotransferase
MIAALSLAMTMSTSSAGPNVLVFSKTGGYRHDSIPVGIQMLKDLATEKGFTVEATEDSGVFSGEGLKKFNVVVFLSTTGDILNNDQQAAFEKWISAGHGYVGIHAAADTEYDWPFYGQQVVGAWFKSHPRIQKAKVKVEDRKFVATKFFPEEIERTDEWYNYRTNPRASVHVLMSLDEKSYEGGGMPDDHPITWWKEVGKGRAFYTGFGHTSETYAEPDFRRMITEAVFWAAKKKLKY